MSQNELQRVVAEIRAEYATGKQVKGQKLLDWARAIEAAPASEAKGHGTDVRCDAIPKHDWETISSQVCEYEPTLLQGWQRCRVCGTRSTFTRDNPDAASNEARESLTERIVVQELQRHEQEQAGEDGGVHGLAAKAGVRYAADECCELGVAFYAFTESELDKFAAALLRRAARVECRHEDTRASWDYVTCTECGSIHTGSNWGIASNAWFKNVHAAKFYKENGRLPVAMEPQK